MRRQKHNEDEQVEGFEPTPDYADVPQVETAPEPEPQAPQAEPKAGDNVQVPVRCGMCGRRHVSEVPASGGVVDITCECGAKMRMPVQPRRMARRARR